MTAELGVAEWWSSLGAAVLVGTARRAVPPAPGALPLPDALRTGVSTEATVLDHVAVGSALRRSGRLPKSTGTAGLPEPAQPDGRRLAPPRARQLLDLLLTQSPVGPRLAPRAILVWLRSADEAEVRVHHASLVPLLTIGAATPELRPMIVPVLDNRGAWLATLNPEWRWATTDPTPPAADLDEHWVLLPTDQRATRLRTVRAADPARGLGLLASTWSADSAAARADLLRALGVGLSMDDEPFLEDALDDRAAGVREVAYVLLDRLPGSARARRLGTILESLLSTSGVVRRKVHVELPSAPDAVAVRDGLGKAPKGRSERGMWLQRIVAGAPLEVWTRATGLDAETVARTLDDADALRGLHAAAAGRQDATWSRALLRRGWDPVLARALPTDELAELVTARIAEIKNVSDLAETLRVVPGPWSEKLSASVMSRLGRIERPRSQLPALVDVLADRLHPDAAPAVQRLARAEDGTIAPLQQLSQFLSLVPTITEAFR